MPGSDRSKGASPLEAFFCILAGLLFVLIVGATGRALGVEAGRNEVSARQHYENAKKDALESCARAEGGASIECVTKAIESAQEKSESRQDLYAQQDMAKWAFWMLIASLGTFIVTAFGVWFVKSTLDATLLAVKETSDATRAMQEANAIAAMANRPYLIVQPEIKKATIYDPAQRVIFAYRNYGTSPARLVRHFFALVEKADGAAIEQEFSAMFPGKSFPDGMVVGTGESSSEFFENAEKIVIGGPALDINFLEQSYSVWKDAYFFGSVIYADIGGNHWCRRFCWTIENNSVDLQETDPARNSEYRSDKDGNPI